MLVVASHNGLGFAAPPVAKLRATNGHTAARSAMGIGPAAGVTPAERPSGVTCDRASLGGGLPRKPMVDVGRTVSVTAPLYGSKGLAIASSR